MTATESADKAFRRAALVDSLLHMFDGVMLLWWILTIPSFLFVVIDVWRTTPESPVLKWAFVILTAFTGPLGAFFYVLGCREPLRGNHEQYVAARWRQVLGSTMHCVAGDGIGIVVGAAIGGVLTLSFWPDFLLEYVLGFGFGVGLLPGVRDARRSRRAIHEVSDDDLPA
jgi:hypothetical protein